MRDTREDVRMRVSKKGTREGKGTDASVQNYDMESVREGTGYSTRGGKVLMLYESRCITDEL